MAFWMTKVPIKILLVVPVTILMCLLFWNMYYESLGWAAFGFVFALFISHGIIEILYNFDFRKLFANPVHLGISAVLALRSSACSGTTLQATIPTCPLRRNSSLPPYLPTLWEISRITVSQ